MKNKYNLAKWLNNDMSEDDLNDFKQNQDYAVFNSIKEHSAQLKTEDFNSDNLLHSIKLNKNDSGKVIQMAQNWFFRIVALILVSLGIYMFYQQNANVVEFSEKGKKNAFVLPDNSEITLNSDSEIKYNKKNWDNNRTLQLEGEAYFKVAKGKTFEVNTPLGKVTVLGTQFNVKARNNRFDVVCYEGKVKVNHNNQTLFLLKGDKISYENNELLIQKRTTDNLPSWLENELLFEQEQLKNIFEEIERQYNISIHSEIKNSNQLFTGKIPNNNLEVALEIIATTYQLKTHKVSDFHYELRKLDEL